MLITDGKMSVHLIKSELVDTELIFWHKIAADHLHRSAGPCSSVKKAHLFLKVTEVVIAYSSALVHRGSHPTVVLGSLRVKLSMKRYFVCWKLCLSLVGSTLAEVGMLIQIGMDNKLSFVSYVWVHVPNQSFSPSSVVYCIFFCILSLNTTTWL